MIEAERVSIITVTIQSMQNNVLKKNCRLQLLEQAIREFHDEDVLLFPAGYFSYWRYSKFFIRMMSRKIQTILKITGSRAIVCFGIDLAGGKDQLAIAVDQTGIQAVGRKFFPTKDEVGYIRSASGYNEIEQGYPRIFQKKEMRFYLAVCYDGFGIRNMGLANPNVDVILILAHQFHKPGEGLSGAVDFARKGFAGASMHWRCPAFGTAVFFNWKIPEKWPTGVKWDNPGQSVKAFKYTDNQLSWVSSKTIEGWFETALCYKYCLNKTERN